MNSRLIKTRENGFRAASPAGGLPANRRDGVREGLHGLVEGDGGRQLLLLLRAVLHLKASAQDVRELELPPAPCTQ